MTETDPQAFARRTTSEAGDCLHENRWEGKLLESAYEEAKRAIMALLGQRNAGSLKSVIGAIGHGAGGANVAVAGEGLIPAGWRQSRVQITTTDATAAIIWEAIRPGAAGNALSVRYVDNAGATAVDWDGAARLVTVGLNITGAGDTAANVVAALAASTTGAQYVVQARYPYGLTGAGTIDEAVAATLLAGGTGVELLSGAMAKAEGGNKDIEFIRRDVGLDAKPVYVSFVHSAGMTTFPTVAVTEAATRVDVVVTFTAATHTAAHVLQALRDSADAQSWISCHYKIGQTGAGLPAAFAAALVPDAITTSLDCGATGGEFPECVPCSVGSLVGNVQSLTDDGFTFDVAAGAGAAGSSVNVRARICGVVYEIAATTAA
jgi:hypothetical protein